MKKRKISFGIAVAAVLFLAGAGLFLYPYITNLQSALLSKKAISAFRTEMEQQDNDSGNALLKQFYQDAQNYNRQICENRQAGLKDQYSYEKSLFNLSDYGMNTDVFGYITIPKINIELPLYLGASKKNMALGAVQLTYTSLPLDQESTNCVIAAHRGYRGAPFFRHIDALKQGDVIILHTPWNKMTYQVTGTKIIDKNDISKVYIQKGKKLLTLSSCHPYTKNTHRYLVYAALTDCTACR